MSLEIKADLKKRSPNWLASEEAQLAAAYLGRSQDAAIGTNQDSDTLWANIALDFNAASKVHVRDAAQCKTR